MKRRIVLIPLGAAMMLAYGLFTGGPDVPMDDYAETGGNLVPEAQLDTLASEFGGKAIEVGTGLTVSATKLKAFKASDPDSIEEGSRPQVFDITITNETPKKIDLFAVAIVETDIEGSKQAICIDIFDEAKGILGVPFEPLRSGESVTFPWAMGCPGDAGTQIDITIAITEKVQVKFSGKLA